MKSNKLQFRPVLIARQRGVVLFFALMALLAISLAAVALVRSVDTSTMIAGNLAFKQSATSAGGGGIEAAITWLDQTNQANAGVNMLMDPAHPFNQDNPGVGYYSSVNDVAVPLGNSATWTNANSRLVGTDASTQNTVRYIIQRICRTSNAPVNVAGCLFAFAASYNGDHGVLLPQDVCKGAGCPVAGQLPQLRITSRIDGPKNTVSYVQAFVY